VDASWKCFQLPIGRVKKIMKTEGFALKQIERSSRQQNGIPTTADILDISSNMFMVSTEAQILQTKACEFFIREVAARAWRHTDLHRRKTIQKGDIWASVGESEVFDFLIDIIPRAVTSTNNGATDNQFTVGTPAPNATTATNIFTAATAPMMYNTNIAMPHNAETMMVIPPTTAEAANVSNPPIADLPPYPQMGPEVAQPAFNFDNVSFVPISHQQTEQVLDETVLHQQSQPWTLEGNADL
jgi:histone H3/H4